MAKASTTGEILRAYGFDTEGEDGALVRMRGKRPIEQFVPVEGGWNFYVRTDGQWVRKFHHVEADENGFMQPDFLWPDEFVNHVYSEGLKSRAAQVAG